MVNYSYQNKAAKEVLKNALNNRYLASVLAACPSAGKTTISHKIVNSYLVKYPNAKILVLTEGQNTLKNQYIEELEDANVPINFTYGALDSNAQVRVGIPQSIEKLDWDSIDLLIVDEAHRFYHANMVQEIIKKLQPKHQVLMTGSPTEYNLHNQTQRTKYAMYYISAEELQKYGVFSAVNMDVALVENSKCAHEAIASVLTAAKNNKDNTSKIMVACKSIVDGKKVADYLRMIKGYKVSFSTSVTDKEDVEIAKFKNDETNALVVVCKGVLGFNDKNITLLADLRSSNNLDASYQLFARVLRIHPEDVCKSYYRVGGKDYKKQILILHKMKALMKKEIFKGFTGKNLILKVA